MCDLDGSREAMTLKGPHLDSCVRSTSGRWRTYPRRGGVVLYQMPQPAVKLLSFIFYCDLFPMAFVSRALLCHRIRVDARFLLCQRKVKLLMIYR